MEMFNTLSQLLSGGLTATLVIKATAGGKMTVITNFTTEKGGVCDTLAPFTLKGTPDELDNGFLDAIKTPVETVNGLLSNIEAFQKSAQQAEKNAKAAASKPAVKAAPASDIAKKAEQERKKREAEAKARKENFDKAIAEAKTANSKGLYHTAEELLSLAMTLTDDKKVKSDLEKQIKKLTPEKEGFLCSDDPQAAKAALEAFKASMTVPQTEETPQETDAPAQQTSTEQETAPEEETDDTPAKEENGSSEEEEDDDNEEEDNNND